MAITISGENNNDKILASDGVIDQLSGFSIVGVITATSFTGDVTGNLTGNVTGNINNSTLLLQTGSTERVRITSGGKVGVGVDPTNYPGKFVVSGDALICDRDIHSRVASSVANSDRGFKQDTDGVEKLHLYADNSSNIILEGSGGSEKVRITSTGAVLLGTTTASNAELFRIHTSDSGKAIIKLTNSTTGTGTGDGFEFGMNANEQIEFVNKENTDMFFATNNTERLRIDSSGTMIIGGGTSRSLGWEHLLQVEHTNSTPHGISIVGNRANEYGPNLSFAKTRSSSLGGNTIVQDNDTLAQLVFRGADGVDLANISAMIGVVVDGTPAENNVPGAFEIYTGGHNKRLTIDSSGRVLIGTITEGAHTADDLTIAAANGTTGITLRSGTGNPGNIFFSDGTSGDAEYVGFIQYYHADNSMSLATNNTVRLKITSNGDVRIGSGTPSTFGSGTTVHETYNANTYAANLVTSGTHQLQMIASQTHGATSIGTRSNHNLNLCANDSTKMTITTDGNLIAGRTDGAFTYNDTSVTNNTFLELYGGTVAGNRGILSLSGRTGSNNGLLGTIWFVNGNNAGTSPGSTMKLAAAIQASSVTNNNNAQANAGSYIQLMTKAQGGSLLERVRIEDTGNTNVKKGLRVSGEDTGWGVGDEGAFMDYYAAGGMVRLGHVNGASGSAKKVIIYSGSLNRLQIDSNGKVGINQSSPNWMLDVKNSNPGNDSKQAIQRWVNDGQNTLELNMYGGTVDQCQFAATNAEQTISFLTGENTGSTVVSTETTLLMTQNRDIWLQGPGTGNYGGALFIGRSASPYGNLGALRDSNGRPMLYLAGLYPEITMCHEVASNASHGPTLRFQTYVSSTNTGTGSQFTIGTNGPGTVLDIGHGSGGQNANAHNGINNFNGTTRFRVTTSGCEVFGTFSVSSTKNFKISHPLPEKTETHDLVHSSIEGPQADLIYRGVVDLVDGTATVNVDTAGRMTQGTFVALCTNVSCFTSNETDWTAVKGSISGNILTITAQDNTSTATVSWMVVGERKDQGMIDSPATDENGRVITEPLKSS